MNDLCFFVSDLHGRQQRYEKLLREVRMQKPGLVLLGGDLLPHPRQRNADDFLISYLFPELQKLVDELDDEYPVLGLIPGNDDPRIFESTLRQGERRGLFHYLHFQKQSYGDLEIAGYAYVPPTPFLLKDWERYDVSRYTDPGSIPPTEGIRTVETAPDEARFATIKEDLEKLAGGCNPQKTIFLFHAPPYNTHLDRAGLDGKSFDGVPLDVHVGSIAIRQFIEKTQPRLTLHGHIHESSSLTGQWKQMLGQTVCLSAAWEGQELALIRFRINSPGEAERFLL